MPRRAEPRSGSPGRSSPSSRATRSWPGSRSARATGRGSWPPLVAVLTYIVGQRAHAVRDPRRASGIAGARRRLLGVGDGAARARRGRSCSSGSGPGRETPDGCAALPGHRRRDAGDGDADAGRPHGRRGHACRRRSRPGCSCASASRSASSSTRRPGPASSPVARILGVTNLAFLGGAIVGGVLIERVGQRSRSWCRRSRSLAIARAARRALDASARLVTIRATPRRRGRARRGSPVPMTDRVRLEIDGADRDHHERPPRQAQRVRRRDGRGAVRDPRRAHGAARRAGGDLAGRGQVVLVGPRRRRRSATSRCRCRTTS